MWYADQRYSIFTRLFKAPSNGVRQMGMSHLFREEGMALWKSPPLPCPETQGTCQKSGTKFLNIFFTHVPTKLRTCHEFGTEFLKTSFTHVPTS